MMKPNNHLLKIEYYNMEKVKKIYEKKKEYANKTIGKLQNKCEHQVNDTK